MSFLKINFDDNMMDSSGGAQFVIHGSDSRLVAIGRSHLFETMVLGAELQIARAGIAYVRFTLGVDWIVIEDDSSMIVDWIQLYAKKDAVHLLLWDIVILLRGTFFVCIRYIYKEANPSWTRLSPYVAKHPRRCCGLIFRSRRVYFVIFYLPIFFIVFILDL